MSGKQRLDMNGIDVDITRRRLMNGKGREGESLEDFLKDEDIYEECVTAAVKSIIAEQIAELMQTRKISKTEMARNMATSRAALDRLLDPYNDAVTLESLKRAANILGKKIKLELV